MIRSLLICSALFSLATSNLGAVIEPAREYAEALRPQYHFTAKKGWLNDPNGCVFENGTYHLCFQYDPDDINGNHKWWGHATSADLVHWTEQEPAVRPDALGDIWSGSAVIDSMNTAGFQTSRGDAPIVMMYTASGGTNNESKGKQFTQCLVYSLDQGKTWVKYADNPVIPHIRAMNRDPKLVWFAPLKAWVVAIYLDGSDFQLLSSPDLKTWTKLQDLTVPGTDECPDFYQMPIDGEAGKTAWVFTAANAKYLVGTFDGHTFKPDGGNFRAIQSEFNRTFYAGQTFSNLSDGRRVQIAWMRDAKYPGMPFNQQMTFPTELKLRRTQDGLRLFRMPVREIASLHDQSVEKKDIALNGDLRIDEAKSDLLDIDAAIDLGTAKQVGLKVAGQMITYDVVSKTLNALGANAPLSASDGKITLRVLVDRASIEVFANDGVISLSGCFLPKLGDGAPSLTFFATDGQAKLNTLKVTSLKSAWQTAVTEK